MEDSKESFAAVKKWLILAEVQAIIAMSGSLYLSDVRGIVPCELCWFQRITLYPQVILYAIALWRKDMRIYYYSLPLLVLGWLVSLYHNSVYYAAHFIHTASPITCRVTGPSCTSHYYAWLGIITIPLLSLIAHSVMIFCMRKLAKQDQKTT